MRKGKIYARINKINNKVYIGQTVQDINRRSRPGQMHKAYSSCTALKNAILKYGENNFETKILEDNIEIDKLNEREEYYMKLYNSTNPEKGYNIRKISEGRQIQSEETRKKISERRKTFVANNDLGPAPNRKPHKFIEGIECKECFKCKIYKPLDAFGTDKKSWDNRNRRCKQCANEYKKLNNKYIKLSKEELDITYKNRQQGIKIKAVNIITKQEITFDKLRDACRYFNFPYTSVNDALNNNKEYKGYLFTRI